ncbi:MAG: Gfo/Idh/MocA family oxidoreductase [Verrucomicrobiota bacterium]
MTNRRTFMHQLMGSAAWVAAPGLFSPGRVLGANDRIRIGLIGAGSRGKEIFRAALRCPQVEAAGAADVYTRRLDEAKAIAPAIKTYRDFRQLLEDKSLDALLIATPQHQHALNFVPAIQAGKDVYQEKTMAFNPDHARRMRKAFEGSGRVVQIGMQMNSGAGLRQAQELATPERLGAITAIQAFHYRNAPYGGWLREIPPDCDPEHVDWPAFEGEANRQPFDPQRYMNWRFYWDYSGGNVFENMVHQLGFWYKALGLSIPESVTMAGANYRCPRMELPDTMSVSMNHREKLLFTWNSMFGNAYYGEGYDYLFGAKGTVTHDESDQVRYLPPGTKPAGGAAETAGPSAPARAGYSDYTLQHLQNFFDCIRSRKEPICPFDLGFRTAIACQMAITSCRQQRAVHWDPQTEEIV